MRGRASVPLAVLQRRVQIEHAHGVNGDFERAFVAQTADARLLITRQRGAYTGRAHLFRQLAFGLGHLIQNHPMMNTMAASPSRLTSIRRTP